MLTVLCVLKSGGIYDAEWVRKLRDGVARNLGVHRFLCLSDVDVPCERIPLEHEWPGWWSKLEAFRPDVITGPTLYLDLDTVITGGIDCSRCEGSFLMLQNFWTADMVGSGVMWFSGKDVPSKVYDKFARQPDAYIAHYARHRDGSYVGDQAFIWDSLNRDVRRINEFVPGIKSYKMHCVRDLPEDACIVCFHGSPRPNEVTASWMSENWR